MADTTPEEEGIQTSQEVPREDTTIPQNTISEEVAEISTTISQNTISNMVYSQSSTTDHGEMVFMKTILPESQQNQDQSVVGISTTIPQNTISNVVPSEANKPDNVYTTPLPQEDQDVVRTTMAQNTNSNMVLGEAEKPDGNEMVYTTASPQDSQEDQAVVSITSTMAQNTDSHIVLGETEKPDEGEMVFTVVAMDNNIGDIIQMNPENLPKEVQLSLVQPPPPDDSNLTSTHSGRLSDINQLAIIAASIEEPPKDPENTEDQTPVVQMEDPSKPDPSGKSLKGRVRCTICDLSFSDLPSMRRHRLIHSEDKPYQCDFCDKSFRRKDNLREHRNIHTQENVYKCERCGKTFPRKYTHKVHMSRFCGKPEQGETWRSADKATNIKQGIVANKSSEPCQICFKTFRDASTLKRHLLTHSDDRPYKCSECDKAFRRKDHLQEHVIVHKLVRPFSCQTCNKSFSRKNGLKTHMIRTTHLLGFDDIILSNQSKSSSDVEVHVVEHVLAADQLVATSSEVFPEGDNGTVSQPTSGKHVSESSLQPDESDPSSVAVEFSEVPTNSEEEAETTLVLSEKRAEATELENPENDGAPDETSAQHVESNVVKAFVCPTCNATFPRKDELWKHFQEHLDENMFACRHCFQIYESADSLEAHQKNCDGGEDESAMRNEGDSPVSEGDSQNSVDQTADATIEEGDDENPLATPSNSKKRKRVTTPERTDQTCTICNKVFRDGTALKRHSLVHSGERPHACNCCDKRFRRRDHLKAHVIAHHSGVTSHECKTCDAAFNTRYALTVHVKTCKNRPSSPKEPISEEMKLMGSPESKQCPMCHKVFKDPSTQRRHFRIHSDERPFHCEICTKSFRRKDNLKEHLLCHSEEKPFTCNHCGKSLSRRSSLTNHMNVCPARKSAAAASMTSTATENPIIPEMQFAESAVQDMCVSGDPQEISAAHLLATGLTSSVVTSDMASLDVASSEMTSSEVTPMEEDIEHGLRGEDDGSGNSFPCDECGKIFRAKWTLKFHQRIHTGEKPYTCTTCDRQFRQASHLKIHERTHSGERPYQCQICGRAFIDSSTMKRHERLHKDAADPNAVIDEQHDVITTEEIIHSQDDVIKGQEYVITNQVINDANEASIVQQAVEVSIADEGAIQLLVTTASELSAQPISTNVVPGMNQSGTRLDENNLGEILRECIRNQGQGVEKIQTLEDWQQNHSAEGVEQLIYIQAEEPAETE